MNIVFLSIFGLIAFLGVASMIRNERVSRTEGFTIGATLVVFFLLQGANFVFHNGVIAGIKFAVILFGLVMAVSAVRRSFRRNGTGV